MLKEISRDEQPYDLQVSVAETAEKEKDRTKKDSKKQWNKGGKKKMMHNKFFAVAMFLACTLLALDTAADTVSHRGRSLKKGLLFFIFFLLL